MTDAVRLTAPFDPEVIKNLQAGQRVLITGSFYVARDAVHKKLMNLYLAGQEFPISLANEGIYYMGPCPAPPGAVIGACGPTTSSRMDAYAPMTMGKGLRVMIGKGQRSEPVIAAMKQYGAVYLATTGGCGALLAATVSKAAIVAFPELGAEALRRIWVTDFPAVVAIDSTGRDLYIEGPKRIQTRTDG